MPLGLICLISSILFLVFLIGLIWNFMTLTRQLSEVPPFPVHKTIDGMWNAMTSKFGIHLVCGFGVAISGLVAAITFIAMVVKG